MFENAAATLPARIRVGTEAVQVDARQVDAMKDGMLQLTESQKKEFERNGFLVLHDALTPEEVSHYLKIVGRLDNTCTHSHGNKPRKPGEHLELRNSVAVAPDLLDLLDHPKSFPLVLD